MSKADPFRYFRLEAREIVEELGKGILQLERNSDPAVASRLLRLAHTLKGAARVVKHVAIAEQAHAVEAVLAPLRTPGAPLPAEAAEEVLRLTDAIRLHVEQLGGEPQGAAGAPANDAPARPVDEPPRAVRADIAEMDALLDGISETTIQLASLKTLAETLERARDLADTFEDQLRPAPQSREPSAASRPLPLRLRVNAEELGVMLSGAAQDFRARVESVERELDQVRDAAERLRLVPAATVFSSLERTARDTAREVGKQVTFRGRGGHVRLDADVLAVVQSALVQVVRNAVAHGVESRAERVAANKPVPPVIELEITRLGNRIVFECRDDGRGIDLVAVSDAATRSGVLMAGARPSQDELLRLLLQGGVSTSRSVTEVAGRGIGLDVVREAASRLGGSVELRTEIGRGLVVRIVVPLSLSSFDALIVETGGGSLAAIPLDAVCRTVRIVANDIARAPTGDTVVDDGQVIPFVPLGRLLRLPTPAPSPSRAPRPTAWPAVVVAGNGARVAVAVERLVGRSAVVVRPLPATAPAFAIIAGASVDGEGNPRVVLDPDAVVAAAFRIATPSAAPEKSAVLPVLVIDDSLTTRMLEQSILEAAGYEVDVASSAEEGLERVRGRVYGLCLVDVEMPGMDGFSFVETTQKTPSLRGLPCILVTSRNTPEDRRRAVDVGAVAYVVKSEFDQALLLDMIRERVGARER